MDYSGLESCLQGLFGQYLPLSIAQSVRLAHISAGVILAGSCQQRWIARQLDDSSQQDSRVQQIRRLLDAPFLEQEHLYQAWVKQALSGVRDRCWHVLMDRTALDGSAHDLLTVALAYRKRAIPLGWRLIPYGGTQGVNHIELLKSCLPLIPEDVEVIFHADSEFGHVPMLRFVRDQGWHFIAGQKGSVCYQLAAGEAWQRLDSLSITPRQAVYLQDIQLTKAHRYGNVNLFAFYTPYRNQSHHKKYLYRYCATSLPVSPTLRPLGRRRWGTECFYKDYKSSGWHMNLAGLRQPKRINNLIVILGLCYIWSTCVGRWLCKTGQRAQIDSSARRQLSFFRIGWDFVVNNERRGVGSPQLLTLYS